MGRRSWVDAHGSGGTSDGVFLGSFAERQALMRVLTTLGLAILARACGEAESQHQESLFRGHEIRRDRGPDHGQGVRPWSKDTVKR